MKKSKGGLIALISILTVLAVLLLGLMTWFIVGNKHFMGGFTFGFGGDVSTKLVFDEVYDNTFQYVDIDLSRGDIYLKQSADDKVHVKVYSDKDTLLPSISQERLGLSFKQENSFSFNFSFHFVSNKIEIYLPKNYTNQIELNNKYGDIIVDTFSEAKFKVVADCGDVSIRGAKAIDIESDYGDITIGTAKRITVTADCGDVSISKIEELIADNSYGDITVEELHGFLKLKADCGDITLNSVSLLKNSSIENRFGDVSIKNIAKTYVDAKADFGDVDIFENDRKADITLKIESDCGDISVGERS